jgi:hypothetical protein
VLLKKKQSFPRKMSFFPLPGQVLVFSPDAALRCRGVKSVRADAQRDTGFAAGAIGAESRGSEAPKSHGQELVQKGGGERLAP